MPGKSWVFPELLNAVKAAADEKRLEIMGLLYEKPGMTLYEIQRAIGDSRPQTTLKRLNVLMKGALVDQYTENFGSPNMIPKYRLTIIGRKMLEGLVNAFVPLELVRKQLRNL